jgi:8-oxo-dGTP pyrophosphatase MutT (NUDIX family)
MRPGWGVRHPDLDAVLAEHQPVAAIEVAWRDGTLPLRASAYTSLARLPDDILTSVRCIVQVDDQVVVCTTADGHRHPWPGGRREPGETLTDTAAREVHEETGWLIDRASFRLLGWLHIEHLEPQDADWPYPHPDFLQLVGTGRAVERARTVSGEWSDTEGWEVASTLMTHEEVRRACVDDMSHLCPPFLDLIAG